jgi:hypothetical protein
MDAAFLAVKGEGDQVSTPHAGCRQRRIRLPRRHRPIVPTSVCR